MNAPMLYLMAADLTKMQVLANIDEADVGRMRPGQRVTFRVDAYPTDTFIGEVAQVRLQPTTVQNVVTYSTVISVPNPDLKLKPGMTANVTIEIARKNNVLRIPNAATRFRPTTEMFQVLNQAVPPELERGRGGRGGRGDGQRAGVGGPGGGGGGRRRRDSPCSGVRRCDPAAGGPVLQRPPRRPQRPSRAAGHRRGRRRSAGRAAALAAATPGARRRTATAPRLRPMAAASVSRGAGSGWPRWRRPGGFDPNMTPEERRKRFEERLAQMTPEERERFQARMREGGGGRGGFGGGEPRGRRPEPAVATVRAAARQGAGGANGAQAGNRQGGRTGQRSGASPRRHRARRRSTRCSGRCRSSRAAARPGSTRTSSSRPSACASA